MNIDIWKELESDEVLWVLNHLLPNVVEGGWDQESMRFVKGYVEQAVQIVPDRLTYREGAWKGARVGAALSVYTFGLSVVPMTMTGIGIGIGLAYLID